MRRHIVLPALLSALPLALLACGDKAPADPRTGAPLVRAAIVKDAPAAAQAFTGIVAARVQGELGFRVAGKVLERLVDAGQTVKRGQTLMRIDPADLALAASAQQEAVAAARAHAQQTAQEQARYHDLRGSGAISASAYDQAEAAAQAAQAQLRAAEAQARLAANASRYAVLVADADGVVMETLAEPGQVVSAGQPVIRLAQAGRREAIVQLPETLRPAIGSAARATIFGREGTAMPATLRQLSNAADRLTRTFEARYVLDGELANIPLGSTVTIRIAHAPPAAQGALWIPLGALADAGKGPGVWLIEGEPAKVAWRAVALQRLDDDGARISGGLKQGDRIVALGSHLLREGVSVRVAGPGGAGAQP
ncbi:efflux RND transporter periplasmic adaptor subunit [Massilia sp. CCM 8695]|uniref:Efflux RND transporter periplasmic adaptor subunit n=1 Tax=Massilia frigida TaxID=2609281 RepID=A0ABX0NJ77_9BURK|nr:efflux RND transporter periplasmic adaptor subunit [Massilia frigida]NHZ81415.1 efflux RND transporter periplasmic adaptor subunit [Massilia frigida]